MKDVVYPKSQFIFSDKELTGGSTPLDVEEFFTKNFNNPFNIPSYKQKDENRYFALLAKIGAFVFLVFLLYVVVSFPGAKTLKFLQDIRLVFLELKESVKSVGLSVEEYYKFFLGANKISLNNNRVKDFSLQETKVAGEYVEIRPFLNINIDFYFRKF